MRAAAKAPRQHNAPKRPQSQLFMKEPDEPDWSHPELGPDPEESAMEESSLREADTKESEDVPLLPEEESHGVRVVVLGANVSTNVAAVTGAGAGAGTGTGVASPVEASPSMMARTMRDDITKKKALTVLTETRRP